MYIMNLSFSYTKTIDTLLANIEQYKSYFSHLVLSNNLDKELREESRIAQTHYSTAIEGNSLSYDEVKSILSNKKRKPKDRREREVINYYDALLFLEDTKKSNTKLSLELIYKIHNIVERKGKLKNIPIRSPTPPGVLFAVYDSLTKTPSYIPPECNDIPDLLDELIHFYNTTDLPVVIKACLIHYGFVTIHPYEDGNGRTARLIANYILMLKDYDANGQLCVEKYFYEQLDDYYSSLSMNLSELYYDGRENPPHLEIWVEYYSKIMEKNMHELVHKKDEKN